MKLSFWIGLWDLGSLCSQPLSSGRMSGVCIDQETKGGHRKEGTCAQRPEMGDEQSRLGWGGILAGDRSSCLALGLGGH